MGKIADIVTAPGFAEKSPLEKAQARRDLFALALQEHPEVKQAFDAADDAGKQSLADKFKAKLSADFPDAFTTRGFKVEIGADGTRSTTETRAPVYDIGTEQILARTAPISARGNGGFSQWQDDADKLAKLPEDQRHVMAPFVYERYGDSDMLESPGKPLFGKPEDFIQRDESGVTKALKFAIPALTRLSLPLMASVTKKPAIVAAAGAVGDAGAQVMEKMMGTRATFSPIEMGLSSALSVVPAATVAQFANPALNLAARVGVRAAEGAAQGIVSEGVRQIVDEGHVDGAKLGMSAGFGVGVGALIGAFEPKIAALLAGKTREDGLAALKKAATTAAPEEKAALSAAQAQIEKTLGIGGEFTSASDTVLARSRTAAESAETLIGERDKLAGQFTQAKAEEAAQIAKEGVLGAPESIVLGSDPSKNQLSAIETRPGESAAERARVEAKIAAGAPKVDDGSIPPRVQLSPQAQRIHDEYGFVAPKLATSLAGGVGGFVYGTSTGEDPLDRVKRGLTFGVVGLAGGYMLGKRFLAPSGASPAGPAADVIADVDRVLTKPAGPSLAGRVSAIPEKLRTAFITRFAPLDTLESNVAKIAGTAAPDLPMSRKFEQVSGAGGKALVDVKDFEDAILPAVTGNEKDFDRLLFLKRTGQRLQADANLAIEKARIAGIPSASRTPDEIAVLAQPDNRRRVAGWDLPKVDRGLAQLEAAMGAKRFGELDQLAAGSFQQELDRSLQLQVTAGRISPEAYAAIKSSNDFYAPFRVMKTLDDIDAGRIAPGVDTRQQIVNAITGIDDTGFHLDSPTKVAAENIFNGRVLAEKNLKMLELAKLADADTGGVFIRKLKPWQQPRSGFETVNYFDAGTPMRLEASPDAAEAVRGLSPSQTGVAVEFAKTMSGAFRFGATSANLAFQARNIAFADQPRLLLMSKYGVNGADLLNPLRIPMDFTAALLASVRSNVFGTKDGLARAFYESGAAGSTLQDSVSNISGRFDPGSIGARAAGTTRDVLDKFSDLTRVLEETTKMMGFKRALRIEGIDSMPPAQAAKKLEEIVAEVRNYAGSPDFARGGQLSKNLSMMTLFFNARVQGGASDLSRLAGGDGLKTALGAWARIGTAVGIPAAYFWLRNNQPENKADYAKVPSWERDSNIMVPRYDDKGAPLYFTNMHGEQVREYYRIPKRESTRTIANLAEASLQFAHEKDPAALVEFAERFAENVAPVNVSGRTGTERAESAASGLNPVVKLPVEVMTNRDLFRHRDIVPPGRQGASPENQFYAGSTPAAYVDAAHAMPQALWNPLRSPLMLQHIVSGLTGGFARQLAPDATPAGTRDESTAALAANPVGRVFVRSSQNNNSAAEKDVSDAKRSVRDRQVETENAAVSEIAKLKAMPEAERTAHLSALAEKQPALIEAIASEIEKRAKGFNSVDRIAVTLPVESGERAAFLHGQLVKKPAGERVAYLQDQAAKGIATDAVLEQLAERGAAGKN